jgi:prophage maintenance system killer protein
MQNMHLYNMNDKPIGNRGEIIIYRAEDNTVQLDVRMENETVWLTASQMAELFGRDVKTIRKHINNALHEELAGEVVGAKFASTTQHGAMEGKTQTNEVMFYNLEMITSIGFRVKSKRGIQFRKWANKILKDYLVKGYAINEKIRREQLSDLRQLVQIVGRTVQSKAVESADETQAIFDVVLDYTYALDTLDNYDYERLTVKETTPEERFHATYENAMQTIAALREKFGGSTLFGNEKDDSFKSSIGQIYQTFGGTDLYPSVEEKAAMLLYLVTKNHSFSDGNKRIAATLFLWFLNNNGILYREDGTKRIADNTLVALTLMIAESRTEEKDTMVKVVVNLINQKN